MKVVMNLPRVGAMGWLEEVAGYPLPQGLNNRQNVRVTAVDFPALQVEDANGQCWKVLHSQIDCGRRYEVRPGVVKSESDPEVLRYLASRLAELRAQQWQSAIDSQRLGMIEDLQHILARNNYELSR